MKKKQQSGSACKQARKQKHKIVIGIDQSYADSGIAVVFDRRLMAVRDCKPSTGCSNTERRALLRQALTRVFSMMQRKASEIQDCEIICIIERIRLQSAKPGEQHFLNLDYIKGIGALNALIVDLAHEYQIPVYSVDTRSWKSQVIGSSRPGRNRYGFPEEKWPTIQWCLDQGYSWLITEQVSPRKKKAVVERDGERWTYNDNKADAIGIAMYGFINPVNQKLEEEH